MNRLGQLLIPSFEILGDRQAVAQIARNLPQHLAEVVLLVHPNEVDFVELVGNQPYELRPQLPVQLDALDQSLELLLL